MKKQEKNSKQNFKSRILKASFFKVSICNYIIDGAVDHMDISKEKYAYKRT